ncbi:S-layer homology domain-containing protein [Oscillibacter sp.]|uniref:S-layer homology domain-containing protein n=1 Tax=Oscillibacter sp. TaxID=1945593 RepID=UPI00289E04E5|nr:S-layer homology domain-containing protein [Oscillibacter sp.]
MGKNKTSQRLTAMVLSIIMVVGMMPVSVASAATGITYVDENGVLRTASATAIENTTTVLTNDWYVVEGSVNTTNLTLQNHNVKLILTDGCTLKASATGDKAAIELFNGNSLTIYGQELGTGTISATGSGRGAGIGGSGGAHGSTTGEGQAGQAGGDSGTLTVVGGRVIANRIGGGDGGEGISQNEGKKDGGRGGGGGAIIVKGGSLEVSGKVGGGNGGKSQYLRGGDGGRIMNFTVSGGIVNAGSIVGGNGGDGTYFTTLGGFPNAVGIAGNGGAVDQVQISGGTVHVSGRLGGGDAGSTHYLSDSPGKGGKGGNLNVSGGTVHIAGAVGGGSGSPMLSVPREHGSCTITGGSLKAPNLRPTPTNGGANGNHTVLATTINLGDISDTVAVKHLVASTTYPYGTKDMLTDAEGNLFPWLPEGAVVTQVNTESAAYSGAVAAGESGTLTEMAVDTEKPTALSITPADGTTDLPESGSISITFSEVMAPSAGAIALALEEGSPILLTGGAWSSGNTVYTIPYSRLSYGGVYTITVSGFQDLAGNIMEDNSSCSFQVKILPIYEYVDEAGTPSTASAIEIDSTTTALSSGWYAAQGSLTLTNLSVSGNVRLILTDGCTLTVNGTDHNAAVKVSGGNSLTVYGQTLGTGKLTATSAGRGAGIGGNGGNDRQSTANGEDCGTITINGGTVTTNRIGGGDGGDMIFLTSFRGGGGGALNINGGTVTVSGRIGGGDGSDGADILVAGGNGGNGSSLTIRGGNVSVAGKIGGGAAGSGYYRNPIFGTITYGTAGGAGSCTITGGSVKASNIQPTPKNGDLTASLTTVTLSGVSTLRPIQAIATSLPSTYGSRDMKTDASGKLYLWLPSGALVTDAFSQGNRYTGSISAGASGTLTQSGLTPEPPAVTAISPAAGATDISADGSISVTFSGAMNAWSGSVALQADGLDAVLLTAGIWTYSGTVYTVSYSGLSHNTEYTVTLSGFKDAYGQFVGSESFSFTTATLPKSIAVGVQSTTLHHGTAGSAGFPVTVVSITDGSYSATLDGAPEGVTAEELVISSGSGTLVLHSTADTSEGSHTMTLTIDGTVSGSFVLTISGALPTVESVSVSPITAEVQKGATQEFTAVVEGTNHPAQTVTWEVVGNESSATDIDANGLLTVGADETAASLIVKGTSTVDTSVSGSATVTVTEVPAAPVYQIALGYMFPAATEGYDEQAPLIIPVINTGNRPTDDLNVVLEGRNHSDFILSETGIDSISAGDSDSFTVMPRNGLTAGMYTATVTVSGENGIHKSFDMSFTVHSASDTPVTGVTLDKSTLHLTVGNHSTLVATVEPADATNQAIRWSSSDPGVAIVDDNGAVTTASAGTTIITVTTEDGKFAAACRVTVSEEAPDITYTVTFNPNGGTVSEVSRSVAPGTAVGALPIPTRSGSYSFDGWYTAASGGTQISASTTVSANVTYYAHWTYTGGGGSGSGGGSSSSDNSSAVIVTPPAVDKPNSPTQGEIKVPGTVDGKGNVTVSLTDKIVTDAFNKALAEAKKNGTEQNGITLVLRVDIGNKAGSNVAVNLPKAVQDIIIAKKIVSIIIVVDNPDIRIGIDLAAMQEINKQAKSDANIIATRMNSDKLTGDAKKAIGSRPVFDLKVNYGNGKEVSSFGAGSVSVTIPYTLGANEKAGNVQAVYVDAKGKVHWLVNSVYDSVEKVLRFATSHFSTYGIGYKQTNTAFTDIAGHWAKEDIEFAASRGLFSGTSETKFSPNTAMTRGMFVTALGRLANADVSDYAKSSFNDVKDDAYYMGYIEWASKNNIVNGVGNGRFAPDQSITREQMAVIMTGYAKTIGYTPPKVHIENIFADNAKISTYAKEAVKQMQMAGVISGKNGNLFDPQGTATRAEASAVLRRFVELAISSDRLQGWTMNDSGKWMYYENGKPVTGKKDINGSTYTFDQYGVTADVPTNLRYTTYTMQKGDSFWSIARKLNCTMSELERLNNKSRFSIIYPGDVLRVPEK